MLKPPKPKAGSEPWRDDFLYAFRQRNKLARASKGQVSDKESDFEWLGSLNARKGPLTAAESKRLQSSITMIDRAGRSSRAF
jgi:hypothetical protein